MCESLSLPRATLRFFKCAALLLNTAPPRLRDIASWKLMVTGMAESQDPHGRLEALCQLKHVVTEQGRGIAEWDGWEGSYALNYGEVGPSLHC